ncbi:Periplasmic oligopeptide-binding protein [Vibrio hippocampi]|uniref:Periplasmic oligopeptide-binding protein n=2 Tax=Vibrio hippocampi TaxID=654686 RepID=A0ABM8ZMZ1_9VIBR|nr:Periplasmic oligopeptide-binding protein [Vibrio hippocampi]
MAANVPNSVTLAQTQELVRGNDAEAATLDPANAEGMPEMHILRDLFEGLVIQDDEGNVIPGVAESWHTKDNQTFVFNLRKQAKWSNGDPVTAHDFVYSLQRASDPEFASANGWYLKMTRINNIADIINGKKPMDSLGVKALDDYTLEFQLDSRVPYFVAMTGHSSMMPVHKASVEKYADKWAREDHMVSNGAFNLSKWVVNERIELTKSPTYWNAQQTVLDKVTYIPFENQMSAMNRYASGEIDITSDIPAQMASNLKQTHKEAYTVVPLLCTYYYAFNTQKAPFNDARVRQAVSYSIMRDVITDGITQVGNQPAYTFAHSYVAGFDATQPDYADLTQDQRDAKAKQLLLEAGYNESNPLKANLLYNTSESNKAIAVAIASMLNNNLAAQISLENQEWKSYLQSRKDKRFDILRASWCGDYNETSTFLNLLTSTSSGNHASFQSTDYDAAIDNAMKATDQEKRNQYYDEAETILAEQMPIAPIYYYMQARLVRPNVGGFPTNNVEGRIYSKDLYIVE